MKKVTLTMPWGVRVYRYSGKYFSGYPVHVEVLDFNIESEEEVWVKCPNLNVHTAIAKIMAEEKE